MSDSSSYRDGVDILSDVPLSFRRRMYWGDSDAAQIGYTSKFVDYAIEASEIWWEAVLQQNWLGLRHLNRGCPMVGMSFDFDKAIYPGDRCDLTVLVEKLGRSSLTLKIAGARTDGAPAFTATLTTALIDYESMTSVPYPDDWRARIEDYARECGLRAHGVRGPAEIIDFWFGPPGAIDRFENRMLWWRQDANVKPDDFDAMIRDRFLRTYEAAATGDLDHWQASAEGVLALCLVLDQFPRNLFRGSARSYATDAKILGIARQAIERGFDKQFPGVAPHFFYMPFEHSEDLDDQNRSIALFEALGDHERHTRSLEPVRRHHYIIERFGRFPHRNDVLGRTSTAEEIEFLKEPNSSF